MRFTPLLNANSLFKKSPFLPNDYVYDDDEVREEVEQKGKLDGILTLISRRTAHSFSEQSPPSYKVDCKTAELKRRGLKPDQIKEVEAKVIRELQVLKNFCATRLPFRTAEVEAARLGCTPLQRNARKVILLLL